METVKLNMLRMYAKMNDKVRNVWMCFHTD